MKYYQLILRFTFCVFIITINYSCQQNRNPAKKKLTIVFYNVENLFDLKNEPGKNDGEFTPEGSKNWTKERLDKKLNDISRVLYSINKTDLPEIIGLCEVENNSVLKSLIRCDSIIGGKYKIIHYESPDFRGIDNALLFRPDEFTVLHSEAINVEFTDDPGYTTRDILYVKGKANNNEVFHIFVNHWPSRIGGLAASEPKRVAVALALRSKTDSIIQENKLANIIIMGDMNDEPANKSLLNTLAAKDPKSSPGATLQNLMSPLDKQDKGSYNYRGNWNMLDNIIVSKNLLDEKGFRCTERQGYVFHKKWMEYKSHNGDISPNRTYGGPNYYGGISDHFPVYFILER